MVTDQKIGKSGSNGTVTAGPPVARTGRKRRRIPKWAIWAGAAAVAALAWFLWTRHQASLNTSGAMITAAVTRGGLIETVSTTLVSVTERTREIGIRKAIGATPRDILLQFLIESGIISLIGGLIGIIAGVVSAVVLSSVSGWNTIISSGSVVLALSVSAGIGIFFGIYPASKTAAMHPIDALRYE